MSSIVKTLNILGATGSIGRSAVDVILSAPEKFKVEAVTANRNAEGLAVVAKKLKAEIAVISDKEKYGALKESLSGSGIKAEAGIEALEQTASLKVDITLAAIVGMAGLRPVLAAIRNSKAVAIANKEPLVAAGLLVMAEARKYETKILPVDSEHNAIFQVFDFERPEGIEKIILTASGGPFRKWPEEKIRRASVEEALNHPNWSMGRKISIDSATMMNKALEVIEAHYLFDLPPEKIDVMIHPESVVHSMVEYKDGSVLAQMGASDMRTPLAHVLAWPERMKTPGQRLDWTKLSTLNFERPDFKRFPALALAYEALKKGPYACVALNAANEIAVESFLNKNSGFPDIIEAIDSVLGRVAAQSLKTLAEIEDFDEAVRAVAQDYFNRKATSNTTAA